MTRQTDPATGRREADNPSPRGNEEYHNKAERSGAPGRRLKGQPGGPERSPEAGTPAAERSGERR